MGEYTVIAESPGDIIATFYSAYDSTPHSIPLKSLTAQKTVDIESQYGTGSHLKYAHVQGKINYEGDFEIGTWWVSDAENPETWMDFIRNFLTWNNVQGLSREFAITVSDAGQNGAGYDRSWRNPATVQGAGIVTFGRCLLKGDSLNIGEPGSTASTKYSWTAMWRNPP